MIPVLHQYSQQLHSKSYFRSCKPKCRTWCEDRNCSNPKNNMLRMFNRGRKKFRLQIVKDQMPGTGCWQVKHFVRFRHVTVKCLEAFWHLFAINYQSDALENGRRGINRCMICHQTPSSTSDKQPFSNDFANLCFSCDFTGVLARFVVKRCENSDFSLILYITTYLAYYVRNGMVFEDLKLLATNRGDFKNFCGTVPP